MKVYCPTGKETFEDENWRLKQLVADLSLDNQMLKHLSEGNG
jgi:hypothetical protein